MRKRILWVICSAMGVTGFAQQQPHYTQYVMNQYIVNPAITGIENYTDIKLSHRHQWAGLEGAPVTTYFTAHKSLGKTDDRTTATSFSVDGENPRGKGYWQDYTAAAPHHGIGLQVVNDRMGLLNNLSAALTYAYHLGLSPRTSLAAGFGAGISQMTLDGNKANFGRVAVDPAVSSSNELNRIKPNLSAGLYLYSADYFLGLSAQQIVPQRVDYSNNQVSYQENNILPHFFGTAGYRLLVGDNFNLIPSVMVKYFNPLPVQVEFNAKLQYREFLWAGVSYRGADAIAGMVGINLSNTITMGYSYDYTTSRLNNFSHGSHEFMLGFMIPREFGDTCPRNVW